MADSEVLTSDNGLREELLGFAYSLGQKKTVGKIGGNSRREGASGAMEVAGDDAPLAICMLCAIRHQQAISHLLTLRMSSLDEDIGWILTMEKGLKQLILR